MKRSTLLLLLLLIGATDTILSTAVHAQSRYHLEVVSEPYVDLQDATVIPIDYGDSLYTLDLAGEAFTCFNRRYELGPDALFSIGGHGFVRFDDGETATIIDGFFTTLAERDESSQIAYLLDGEAGSRIMKVEWRNAGLAKGTPDDYVNVQVWIYQTTGVIELRMGPNGVGSQSAFNNGPWLGTFMAVPTFTKALGKCWLRGDPAAPTLDTATNLSFPRLNGAPVSGAVYRLIPSVPASVGNKSRDARLLKMDLSEDRRSTDR